jgi:hypothetical protein
VSNSIENTKAKKERKENPAGVWFLRTLWWQSGGASQGVYMLMTGFLAIKALMSLASDSIYNLFRGD